MNTKIKSAALGSVVAATAALSPMTASAEGDISITGNAGILSDYIFRGIPQSSGTGNGGLDLEAYGIYLGTWVADVEDGIEYDLYGGYIYDHALSDTSNIYGGVGYTSFQYSDDFDDEFNEVNLYVGGSSGDFSLDLEYTFGDYNGDFLDSDGSVEGDDYTFFAITATYGGTYLTYGDFGDDADDFFGNYFELGYTTSLAGFDLTGALVYTMDVIDNPGDELLSTAGDDDTDDELEAYVSISWNFDVL